MWTCNMTFEKNAHQNHHPIGWNRTQLIVTKPPAEFFLEVNNKHISDE